MPAEPGRRKKKFQNNISEEKMLDNRRAKSYKPIFVSSRRNGKRRRLLGAPSDAEAIDVAASASQLI